MKGLLARANTFVLACTGDCISVRQESIPVYNGSQPITVPTAFLRLGLGLPEAGWVDEGGSSPAVNRHLLLSSEIIFHVKYLSLHQPTSREEGVFSIEGEDLLPGEMH